ncbi:glycogen debranching enzyme [Rhizobium sp. BK650]|uniref:amylo-alpha-1,6-glucosidase n=1 Tax=Rhizobium sp. BK650 TaxID=2586990 RepID=UPI00160E8AB9|nr:glycoside hydrolase 100 family protein [Rhizobium sp. BK650]MBB3660118.1 glycogen debranching enzyme [Rhizobium sp. BK650]
MNVHIAEAKRILVANDRGGYTVPTERLYPFQWNWDSAFVAMGFALYDTDRAYRELERLAEGQWADGMIPHIVFHQKSDTYFPGPNVWRTSHTIQTSGITQPPVFAIALKKLHDAAGDKARSLPLYEAALRWHRWWYAARDPEGTGLVALLHPWESGSDNSPAWDVALARVPTTTDTPVLRKDTGHVNASMRPRDEDYSRFIHLVDNYAACGWNPEAQWQKAPFKVAEIQTTAILLKAGQELEALARELGRTEDVAEIAAFNEKTRKAILAQWRPALSRFVSRDLVSGQDIEAPTQAGFIPLLSLDLERSITDALVAEMSVWSRGLKVAFPTTKPGFTGWEPKRYWRGPSWAIINWLLIDGLQRNGRPEFAEQLRKSTISAIETEGFAEYFDPTTGEGCGGLSFSWTAAAYMWLVKPRSNCSGE